jgi:hypothetical protein
MVASITRVQFPLNFLSKEAQILGIQTEHSYHDIYVSRRCISNRESNETGAVCLLGGGDVEFSREHKLSLFYTKFLGK